MNCNSRLTRMSMHKIVIASLALLPFSSMLVSDGRGQVTTNPELNSNIAQPSSGIEALESSTVGSAEVTESDMPANSDCQNNRTEATNSNESVKKIDAATIYRDYNKGLSAAVETQKPILTLLGAEWCVWCKKLEADLESDSSTEIFEQWVVIAIDVDDHPELAERFSANGLPSLRLLDLTERVIASDEGYKSPQELADWLAENRTQVDPELQRILNEEAGPIDNRQMTQLVAFLGDRSLKIRSAAQRRLIKAKAESIAGVVETLRNGSLGQRLSTIDILVEWQAPIEGIDPWKPETLSDDNLQRLNAWVDEQLSESKKQIAATPFFPAVIDLKKPMEAAQLQIIWIDPAFEQHFVRIVLFTVDPIGSMTRTVLRSLE